MTLKRPDWAIVASAGVEFSLCRLPSKYISRSLVSLTKVKLFVTEHDCL
jgi:hypothetical protein